MSLAARHALYTKMCVLLVVALAPHLNSPMFSTLQCSQLSHFINSPIFSTLPFSWLRHVLNSPVFSAPEFYQSGHFLLSHLLNSPIFRSSVESSSERACAEGKHNWRRSSLKTHFSEFVNVSGNLPFSEIRTGHPSNFRIVVRSIGS